MRWLSPFLLLALALLGGCRGASDPTPASEKAALLGIVKQRYLWDSTVPGSVEANAFPDLQSLLDHLTCEARSQGKDRGWTFLNPRSAGTGPLGFDPASDQEVQYGFGAVSRRNRLFIAGVIPGSDAARAGLTRGDEILALAATPGELGDPAHELSALLASGGLEQALGPALPGTLRHFRIAKASGAIQELALTRRLLPLDLVPNADRPTILEAPGGRRVGYLHLKAFRLPAGTLIRRTMTHFRRAGVTDLILDFRYNAGGSLETARLFLNHLWADAGPGAVMARLQGNALAPSETYFFQPEPEALRLDRIAFIVTGVSASASEQMVNALVPHFRQRVALVGSRTYGKPVAQIPIPIPGSSWEVYLVTHQVLNAEGEGGYFQGLPGHSFGGATREAEDDLAHAPGDPAEASTAAALDWIAGGSGRPIPGPTSALALQGTAKGTTLTGLGPDRPAFF